MMTKVVAAGLDGEEDEKSFDGSLKTVLDYKASLIAASKTKQTIGCFGDR
ncbi:hypothetical protein [Variovorax sp.]|nr:hypothetical protein [Variovorax sp.]